MSANARALQFAFARLKFWELPMTFGNAQELSGLDYVDALGALGELRRAGLVVELEPST